MKFFNSKKGPEATDDNTLAGSKAASMEKETATPSEGLDETIVKLDPMFPTDVAELQKIQTHDPTFEYPTGLKLGLTVLALCLSVFLVALVSCLPANQLALSNVY